LRNSQNEIVVKSGECPGYALLDSGCGAKLEDFAGVRLVRPEPKAWWKREVLERDWSSADAVFDAKSGRWLLRNGVAREWRMGLGTFSLELRLNDNSKHVGVFPEQEPHWRFISGFGGKVEGRRLLSLFGYTGAATLAALSAGFSVTHVDASSPSLSWARRNLEISGMASKPVRWILDDALKYVRREIRRGSRYDAVVLDPPAFGRGPKGEIWKLDDSLRELLDACSKMLTDNPLFIVLTIYNVEASSLMPANLFLDLFGSGVSVECGELASRQRGCAKLLPLALFNICRFGRNSIATPGGRMPEAGKQMKN
jgi:23S rRNA (cytosine1962-C5)-methyltransferase